MQNLNEKAQKDKTRRGEKAGNSVKIEVELLFSSTNKRGQRTPFQEASYRL